MRQFITIASNAFMELIRQPVFLLLMTISALFEVFLACINYFGFGDEPKLVKNSALAVMFLAGLFGAVMSASSSVAREIRSGTALAVLAKPIGRAQFLLAKYAGLAGALAILTFVNCIAALLATRMAFDAYGDIDYPGLEVFADRSCWPMPLVASRTIFLRPPFCIGRGFCRCHHGRGGVCGAGIHSAGSRPDGGGLCWNGLAGCARPRP